MCIHHGIIVKFAYVCTRKYDVRHTYLTLLQSLFAIHNHHMFIIKSYIHTDRHVMNSNPCMLQYNVVQHFVLVLLLLFFVTSVVFFLFFLSKLPCRRELNPNEMRQSVPITRITDIIVGQVGNTTITTTTTTTDNDNDNNNNYYY